MGYFDSSSGMAERPSVANKSMETSFFIQDTWRITSRLTLNMGLRYEFSTPYTERYNREQFTLLHLRQRPQYPGVAGGEFPGRADSRNHDTGDE